MWKITSNKLIGELQAIQKCHARETQKFQENILSVFY